MRVIPPAISKLSSNAVRYLTTLTDPPPPRRRATAVGRPGLAYISLRGLDRPANTDLPREVETGLRALGGVEWVEVVPILGQVIIAFDPDLLAVAELVQAVEAAEERAGLDQEAFPLLAQELPPDRASLHRGTVALAADGAGVGIGAVTRLLRVPALPVELASAIPAVDSVPAIRSFLEGRPAVESGVAIVNAVLQGLGQGPLGLLADAGQRFSTLAELVARRAAWLDREDALIERTRGFGTSFDSPLSEQASRPLPLPPGPLEQYGRGASYASLAAGGLVLWLTRDPRRTADVLLAALPRAARSGREGFASAVGRKLAERRLVVMNPGSLRLLDRIDAVVLDGDLFSSGGWDPSEAISFGDEDPDDLRRITADLLLGRLSLEPQSGGGWRLAPPSKTSARWPRGSKTAARDMAREGHHVLTLSKRGLVRGIVAVTAQLDPGAAELLAAAHANGSSCFLSVSGQRNVPWPDGVRSVPGGADLAQSVRALQQDGRAVALVSSQGGLAQCQADLGIGVLGPTGPPPWGADVLCFALAEAVPVVGATRIAQRASRTSVMIAGIGSSAASLFALSPLPGAGRRAMTTVQLAALSSLGVGTWLGAQLSPIPDVERPPPWHVLPVEDVLRRTGSSEEGLPASTSVPARPDEPSGLRQFGQLAAAELINPLSLILGVGAGLSAAVGSVVDATLIIGVLGLDASLGALQRLRTEASISRLANAIDTGIVRVLRDGKSTELRADRVVPGDVIDLSAGDSVSADARLLSTAGLEIDESSLTGESLPVAKDPAAVPSGSPVADRTSMVYEGTAVAAGRARAVVVATGKHTEARRGAAQAKPPETGVEHRLRQLTDKTVPVVLAGGAGLALNTLLRGRPAREALASGVSLAAAAVPEGLPFVATVAQSSTAHRLSKRGVLVRNPRVLEALGRADVLCFDKTGTLTEGHLQVQVVSDGSVQEDVAALTRERRTVLASALRATPRPRQGGLPHPTDQAIVEAGSAAKVRAGWGPRGTTKIATLPFEPGRGYHAVLSAGPRGTLLSVKGAPETVLPRCTGRAGRRQQGSLDAAHREHLEAEVDRLARRGLRVLAVAERSCNGLDALRDDEVAGLTLLGFVAVADTTRRTAQTPVDELIRAGVNVVMVTGDHPSTAEAIASDLGLLNGRRILTGGELAEMEDAQLDKVVSEVAVFARVAPADKVRIVTSFQRAGHVVAMTGDGANDAQAIRLAQVGVAFGPNATSAAREAADLVVTHDDVGVLIEAITECRAMWASVRDALALLLGGNLGEVVFTTGAAFLSGQSPLTARQLLAVNLFTDLAPAMAIAVQTSPAGRIDLGHEGPETSLAGALARDVGIRAGATAIGAYGAWFAARLTGTPTRARTVALAALVGTQLGQTLVTGWRSPLAAGTAILSSAALVGVIQTPGVSHFFDCRPLGPVGWTTAGASAGLSTAAASLVKIVWR